uniref:Uroporphyrinogen-III synthase n=1 Tax=Coralloluteibacterium stylophorae TaxID=1776034 RepID=A0A8J7VRC6_9GAMM
MRGWTLVSLRPAGAHAGLRNAARRAGAESLALSPLRLVALDARPALQAALACAAVIFSSPAAVRFAARQHPLQDLARALAVGAGTAAALRRAGVTEVLAPSRMDSEGLLALPALAGVAGHAVGLVTAPGGRGLIAATLAARGARLVRAEVYRREPAAIPAARIDRLARADIARTALAIRSGEALDAAWTQLPDPLRVRLRQALFVVASARLADATRNVGGRHIAVAGSARPRALVDALGAWVLDARSDAIR